MSPVEALLRPLKIKHLTLRNRVMSTSHAPSYVGTACRKERYQLYHEEKAKGGIGLTMFGGSSSVAADSPASFGQIDIGRGPDHPVCCRRSRAHPPPRLRADDPAHP